MVTRREALLTVAAGSIGAMMTSSDELFAQAPQPATPLAFKPPAGATDTHRHVFGDLGKYPYASTSGYRHPPAWIADMNRLDKALGVSRYVLIQPSGYATDNSALLDVLKQARPDTARGIVAIDERTPDALLDEWHKLGVRGIRVGLGGSADAVARLRASTDRIAARGWHVNTAISQMAMLDTLADTLTSLPVPVVLDHYAGAKASAGTSQKGFATLLQLLKSGKIYLKMSRLHNLSTAAPGYADVRPLAQAVVAANPDRLLWGTDWPHAGIRGEGLNPTDISPYFNYDDGLVFNEFASWVGSSHLKTILVDNPAGLYGFR